jgi:hypothetical protein
VEVVRRIYPVFQDRNWTARPWRIENEQLDIEPDAFAIALSGTGSFDASGFSWQALIEGRPDGTLEYSFRGEARAPFLRNRLGLCVLHPVRGLCGNPVTIEHADGAIEHSAFPEGITPDQPFLALRSLEHEALPGVRVKVRFEGEVFESEDHRNWTDASYKHYCTPISLPFPVEVRPGEPLEHLVTVRVHGSATAATPSPLVIEIDPTEVPVPALGIQLDHDGHRLSPGETALLRDLRLAHARIDLGPSDDQQRLADAIEDASAIGTTLVVALVGADPRAFVAYRDHPAISRWLVFDPDTKVTDPELVRDAAAVLGPRVGGGTNLYFTELNRGRPEATSIIAFSANPQVHFADDESVMQNSWTLGPVARAARTLYPEAFLELSPLTLRPRWNPNATAPDTDVSNTALPSRVDARQATEFAAAWTILALASITAANSLDSVTLFGATGWEGLIERAEGSPQPEAFPSSPGEPYPVYDVLRALAGADRALVTRSSDPDRVGALALADGRVLVANATPIAQHPLVDGRRIALRPYGVVTITRRSP